MSSQLESDVCYRVRVAPSGESYRGNRRPWWMAWSHLWTDWLYTRISSRLNAR